MGLFSVTGEVAEWAVWAWMSRRQGCQSDLALSAVMVLFKSGVAAPVALYATSGTRQAMHGRVANREQRKKPDILATLDSITGVEPLLNASFRSRTHADSNSFRHHRAVRSCCLRTAPRRTSSAGIRTAGRSGLRRRRPRIFAERTAW